MPTHHWLEVDGGDEVLIDLGGWGVLIQLDDEKRWYDIPYVKIDYTEDGEPIPVEIPADMVVTTDGERVLHRLADEVRIWRHGEERPEP